MFIKVSLATGMLVLFWSFSLFAADGRECDEGKYENRKYYEAEIDDFRDANVIIARRKNTTKVKYGVYLRDVSGTNSLGQSVNIDEVVIPEFLHREDAESVAGALNKQIKERNLEINPDEPRILPNLRYFSDVWPLSDITQDENNTSNVRLGGINVIVGTKNISFGIAKHSAYEGFNYRVGNIPHKDPIRIKEKITTQQRVKNVGKGFIKGIGGLTGSVLDMAILTPLCALNATLSGLNNGMDDGIKMAPFGLNLVPMVGGGAVRATMGAFVGTSLGAYEGAQAGRGLLRSAKRDLKSAFTGERSNPKPYDHALPPSDNSISE
jgi:hypothetical protein